MKVIFDSNIWQIVTIPDNYSDEPDLIKFRKINDAILNKQLDGYISETIFTIEAIRKTERQDFFSSTNPTIKTNTKEEISGSISLNLRIEPNEKDAIHFDERPILKRYFDAAQKIGLKIAACPRIGGLTNPEIEAATLKLDGDILTKYLDTVYAVGREIESKNAGISHIKQIGKKYKSIDDNHWLDGLKRSPETEGKNIAKAAAEWADGDSVAISIALNCDYFCTRDQAKGAGNNSILSPANISWLQSTYGFKTITPEALADLI